MVGKMAFERMGERALDYDPCRYGASKLLFRGPRRRLEGEYCAVLGGTETYGRFIEKPFPALIEAATGMRMVNLGYVNAGVDVFLNDAEVTEACQHARVTVVQVLGAHNMSNRYYAVHPRRNDRFLRASPLMKSLFREVDFTEFHFTRHMLSALQAISPDKFAVVADELQMAWVARMKQLLTRLGSKTVLLWMADHAPEEAGTPPRLDHDPLLVNRAMVEEVRLRATVYLEMVISQEALAHGAEGMVVSPFDQAAAVGVPGPAVHEEVARQLAPVLRELMA
jgi:hypothetical protein